MFKQIGEGQRNRILRGSVVLLFSVVLSYIFTSVIIWASDSRYIILSRYSRFKQHESAIKGETMAPDQYRFGSFYLVEYFFRFLPIKWHDNQMSYDLLSKEGWDDDSRKTMEMVWPESARYELVNDIQDVISDVLDSFVGSNLLLKNMLTTAINSTKWPDYVIDVEKLALLVGEYIPEDILLFFNKDSYESSVVNGYFNMRFFFTIIVMVLIYLFCREFLDPFSSLAGVMFFSGMIPLAAQDFQQAETMCALTVFLLLLILIARRKSYLVIILCVVLGCTLRTDHMLFAALIYSFHEFPNLVKRRSLEGLLRIILLLGLPLIATFILSSVVFPQAEYYVSLIQIDYNLGNVWSWIFPAVFMVIPLVFSGQIREMPFFASSWYWIVPFLVLNYIVGRPSEVRLLLPVLVYSIPFIIKGTKSLIGDKLPESPN